MECWPRFGRLCPFSLVWQCLNPLEKYNQYIKLVPGRWPSAGRPFRGSFAAVPGLPLGFGARHDVRLDLVGACSRRISIQHRLVYQVLEDEGVVQVLRLWSLHNQPLLPDNFSTASQLQPGRNASVRHP